jgi:phosphohistidine swiveling domain-containing protein
MADQWVFFFGEGTSEGDPSRKDLLGGKGASLAAMSRAGLPVPPGFTISAECCRLFFEGEGQWPPGLEAQVRDAMARLERATGRRFGEGAKPLLVSVRSGAAVSMPGMMDTILNCGLAPRLSGEMPDPQRFWHVYSQFIEMFAKTVAGIDPAVFPASGAGEEGVAERLRIYEKRAGRPFPVEPWQALVECIDAVFNSWNNERAIVYRQAHDIRGLVGTAVTVQAMFPSEVSGVLFTANPNNLGAQEMVIDASFGLGESVVSGDVTPDHFTLDRETLAVRERVIGRKTHVVAALDSGGAGVDASAVSLTDAQLTELGRMARRVEDYFKTPLDIEWGLADGRFALLQSRPIRGLEIAEDVEVGRRAEIERLKALAKDRRHVWVVHNLAETLSAPTPLTWDIVRHFMSGRGGFGRMYQQLGYQPSAAVKNEGFLELICGRIYADPARTAGLFWEHMPLAYDLDQVRADPATLETAPTSFDTDRADGQFLRRLPATLLAMLRSSRRMKRLRSGAVEHFQKRVLPAFLDYVAERRSQDLTHFTTEAVIQELHERRERVLDQFGPESLMPGFFGGLARAALEGRLTQVLGPKEGNTLCLRLTSGLDNDITIEQNEALYEVAKNALTMSEYLDRFGHRAVDEMELAQPRWREDPAYLKQMLRAYQRDGTASPMARHDENSLRRQQAERDLPAILAHWGGASFREDVQVDLIDAQALLPYRELGKHYLMMGYETIRLALVELARRWDLGRDLFFLRLDELERFEKDRETLMPEIARRKTRWLSAKRLDHPDVIDSNDLESLGLARTLEAATELKGNAVASGVATGPARIVFDPAEAGDLGADYILVCPSTDPGWTALFVNCRGLVVERGGALSHGAIVARDFGIPAVVCSDATRRIAHGATVRVDGNKGLITVLAEGQ